MIFMDLANWVNDGHEPCSASNPTKYLLSMDILGGLAEQRTTKTDPAKYANAANVIAAPMRTWAKQKIIALTSGFLCSV